MLQAPSITTNTSSSSIIDENFVIKELANIFNDSQDRFFDIEDGITKCKQILNTDTDTNCCNVLVIKFKFN